MEYKNKNITVWQEKPVLARAGAALLFAVETSLANSFGGMT